jgi:hypothetical protein
MLRACTAVLMLGVCATFSLADGTDVPRRQRLIRPHVQAVDLVPLTPVVPDCLEGGHPRLLNCALRVYVKSSGPVLMSLEAPPPRLQRPYPRLFSWPYGAN